MMKIVVTGATGTLGMAIMERLRKDGNSVIGIGRSKTKINQLIQKGFEIVNCDITDAQQLSQKIIDCEVIIHCAAFAAPFGSKKKFFQTNVEGTKNVFQVAREKSVSRIVVVSSASIFDGMNHDQPHNDDTPDIRFRPRHHYGASKFDAENFCLTQPKDKWIGLRPRAVFGKGDQTLLPRLKKLIGKNHYKTIGDGNGLIDVTCLSNFVDAVCLAIKSPQESLGKFYNISNGDPRTFNSIMKTYTGKFGSNFKQRKLPYYPILIFAYLSIAVASFIPGKRWEPSITPYGLRQITSSLTLDISEARQALNWSPTKTFEQGMEELE